MSRSLEELETTLDATQAALAALTAEKAAFAAQFSAAAARGDAKEMLKLRRRQDELPAELFAAETHVLRSQIALLDAQAEEYKTALEPLKEAVAEKMIAVKQAEGDLRKARQATTRVVDRMQTAKERRGQLQRKLEDLVYEQGRPPGVVVRSLQHQPH